MQYYEMMNSTWPRVDWIARKSCGVFRTLYGLIGSYACGDFPHDPDQAVSASDAAQDDGSMNKMQKLQPEMKKIQEKYKNQTSTEAQMRMRQETMDLLQPRGHQSGGRMPADVSSRSRCFRRCMEFSATHLKSAALNFCGSGISHSPTCSFSRWILAAPPEPSADTLSRTAIASD